MQPLLFWKDVTNCTVLLERQLFLWRKGFTSLEECCTPFNQLLPSSESPKGDIAQTNATHSSRNAILSQKKLFIPKWVLFWNKVALFLKVLDAALLWAYAMHVYHIFFKECQWIEHSFERHYILYRRGFYFEIGSHRIRRTLHSFQREAALFEGGIPLPCPRCSSRNTTRENILWKIVCTQEGSIFK